MLWIQQTPEGVIFKAVIQPRASRNEIVGLKGDALKIRLTAPPVEGAANKMCIELLAKTFKVRKSDVEIVRGKSSKSKQILVRSATRKQIESLLESQTSYSFSEK
ncbi:MAG: YggU family protein [Desulfobacterales bacterium C00003060]|nr:MAG: YggU family protein [Desulfobacterales bacterium S3730MH5]OEU78296.1 MAG: YggU family protein [Desulfobacterales bacterium C00003060]OEU83696.1 MAG: YggU family protein [Desulfobacterales bacterium S5133MH4]